MIFIHIIRNVLSWLSFMELKPSESYRSEKQDISSDHQVEKKKKFLDGGGGGGGGKLHSTVDLKHVLVENEIDYFGAPNWLRIQAFSLIKAVNIKSTNI